MNSDSLAGHLPFLVVVNPRPVELSRFGRALVRSGAKVTASSTGVTSVDPWQIIVWVRPSNVPLFESLCLPETFTLLSHREAQRGLGA